MAAGDPAHLPYYAPEASNQATDAEDTGRVTPGGAPILRPRGVDPDARARLDTLILLLDGVEALLTDVRDRTTAGGATETTLTGVRDLLQRLPADPATGARQSDATARLDDLLARVGLATTAPGEDTVLDVLRRVLAANDGLETINAAIRDITGAPTDVAGANTVLGQLKAIAAGSGGGGGGTTGGATEATLADVLAGITDLRARTPAPTLTSRMLAKQPATGHALWLHDGAAVTDGAGNAIGTGTILAEAPNGSPTSDAVWNGLFVPEAPGRMRERTGFSWDQRLAGW